MQLVAVVTRRKPTADLKINSSVSVVHIDDVFRWKNKIDVMVLCGGSKDDLPVQTPQFVNLFNVVDSFDTHAKILQHLDVANKIAKKAKKTVVVSAGWDPGLFSINRLYMGAVLPRAAVTSFWGEGVSQGHSDAIRKVNGVEMACQYTVPIGATVDAIRQGSTKEFTAREKHKRICFVVTKDGVNKDKIKNDICSMPDYFADYDTTVNFIDKDEFVKNHSKLPHGGTVIANGKTSDNHSHTLEFSIKLDSNPEFTASVLLAYARAVFRMTKQKQFGAYTVYDVPPVLLSQNDRETAIKELL